MFNLESLEYRNNNLIFTIIIGNPNKLIVNKNIKYINSDFLNSYLKEFFRITSTWKKEYLNMTKNNIWKIVLKYHNGDEIIYSGRGEYPYNMSYLEKLNNQLIKEASND